MIFNCLEFSIKDSIGHIVLQRPDVLNALNKFMVQELQHAINQINENRNLKVLIISGSNGNFAAGADIENMVEMTPEEAGEFSFNETYNLIEDLSIPVIAAISGYALGGGLELALACDFRVCSSNAILGLPEIKIGIFPGAGGTQRLPKIIGQSRAKEMIFSGRPIDAETAMLYGLCDRLTDGEAIEEAFSMAQLFSGCPPIALGAAKKAITKGMGINLKSGIQYEYELWASLFSTDDQKEGMKAFLEKRNPIFTGK